MATEPTAATVTQLLGRLESGDRTALDELFPLVLDELRALAHSHRRRWHGDETLGTTALVHETWLKLAGGQRHGLRSRGHFLAVAATAMRHILTNYARDRRRLKRGGELRRVSLDALGQLPAGPVLTDEAADVIAALDDALHRLASTDARLGSVVECRFFGGLSIADTAVALDISPATVKRDWTLARAWLFRELAPHVEP